VDETPPKRELMNRLPRFKRVSSLPPMQLTERDRQIVRLVHRYGFVRSSHIVSITGQSRQQILRRLQLLYHNGYLERPRAQLRYYERGGSRDIAYGLGRKGGKLLYQENSFTVDPFKWNKKNHVVGRLFLEHALFVSDVMTAIELACRKHGAVDFLDEDVIEFRPRKRPFQWRVKLPNGKRLSVIPDRIFALRHTGTDGRVHRIHYFLEADRGTMPVQRRNLTQTSFRRKLLAYAGTWKEGVHRSRLGIDRFRVLTVTTVSKRVNSLITACSQLPSGHGLFLFADRSILSENILSATWRTGRQNETAMLLD
jgi:hypothetical protein